MGGFGHQRHALGLHPVGDLADDRPECPAGHKLQRSEQMRGTFRHLGLEDGFGQGGKPLRLGAAFHPDHGRTGAPVAIGQGHEGEGPARAVDLGRDILVRDRVRDGKGQSLLTVAQGGRADAHRLADGAGAAIGADHQFRRDPAAVGQGHAGLGLAGEKLRRAGAGAEIDSRQGCQMGRHLAPQKPVGQVPAKGQVRDVGGIEIMGDAGFGNLAARIDDAHDLKRHGMGRKPVPEARAFEKLARGLQKGGCAQVRSLGCGIGHGGRRVGADDREPRLPEGRSGGQTGDAAAGNEDVGVCECCHAPEVGRSGRLDDATGCPKPIFRTKKCTGRNSYEFPGR